MLQKVTDKNANVLKTPAVNGGRNSYFNKEALGGEIIALLSVRPSLSAGEIDRCCPSSPEQQAVSDTLRKMKRQGLVRMDGRKTWRVCEGVQYNARHLESVLMYDGKTKAHVSMDMLRGLIVDALRTAFGQPRKKHLTHTELVAEFVGSGVCTKHAISQALEQLVKEGLIIKPGDRIHNYMYNYAYFAKHPSLFDGLQHANDQPDLSPNSIRAESMQDRIASLKVDAERGFPVDVPELDVSGLNETAFSESSLASDHAPDDPDETEADRRRRKMRIRRRVLVAQTRIQVQVRRRHKGQEE